MHLWLWKHSGVVIYSYSKEGSPIALKRDQCFKLVCEKLPFIFSIKSIRRVIPFHWKRGYKGKGLDLGAEPSCAKFCWVLSPPHNHWLLQVFLKKQCLCWGDTPREGGGGVLSKVLHFCPKVQPLTIFFTCYNLKY